MSNIIYIKDYLDRYTEAKHFRYLSKEQREHIIKYRAKQMSNMPELHEIDEEALQKTKDYIKRLEKKETQRRIIERAYEEIDW